MTSDEQWMHEALLLADIAADKGEVPVGAIVVLDNIIIGRGWNQPITTNDPTAHAEIVALRDAAKNINNYRLVDAELFVTLEPCSMCAGALVHSRIRRLVFGAAEPKAGVVISKPNFFEQHFLNHQITVTGDILAELSAQKLQAFFQERRMEKKALKE